LEKGGGGGRGGGGGGVCNKKKGEQLQEESNKRKKKNVPGLIPSGKAWRRKKKYPPASRGNIARVPAQSVYKQKKEKKQKKNISG